ncbi:hypothetical protein [Nitratireductor sp. XY-223]|uniref:hypothetical protein n=1 Tax=Nitratireductor sp. XY-223 TaxID=2561926 RepID=UPI0010A998F5|nr:hypothetical protein [Nitratireductor sp. XY-223]
MADPEITGSKDLLRSCYYLYDKSEKFRKIFNDPEWKKRNFKKIELIWRNGPRNPYAPNSYAASARLVGDGPDRTWRIEVNWNLMGRISDDNVGKAP